MTKSIDAWAILGPNGIIPMNDDSIAFLDESDALHALRFS